MQKKPRLPGIVVLWATWALAWVAGAAETDTIERKISAASKYLASDELEGRGIGTTGLDKAADYIANELATIGLKTDVFAGGPFQKFTVTTDAVLGPAESNHLAFTQRGSTGAEKDIQRTGQLELNVDFSPLAAGGSGKIELPVVFCGYGITDDHVGYDDYAGIDVTGKCVIVLRHQPQRGNPHSPFERDPSDHAYFRNKISNAVAHGAAAIIFCTGQYEIETQVQRHHIQWQAIVEELSDTITDMRSQSDRPAAEQKEFRDRINRLAGSVQRSAAELERQRDPLLGFYRAGGGSPGRRVPVFHCRRAVIDNLLQSAAARSLESLEKAIDEKFQPQSFDLDGWSAVGETKIRRRQVEIKNVVGILDGEGPTANETIVIGAHYDHLGYGGPNSAEPTSKTIHNGADDNSSGIAVLLDVARRLTQLGRILSRRVVFVAFTGEESGLYGSAHYVENPLFPIKDTVAMINLDMVGRLKNNRLIVFGTGTAPELDVLVKRLNAQHLFDLAKRRSGFGPSDHTSFYEKKIPVLHMFTGSHSDYHRPTDDYHKLNIPGMRRIGSYVADITMGVAQAESRPTYQMTKRTIVSRGGWPYFGSRPDYGHEQTGVRMAGVAPGSPADRAGIKKGDVILQFGSAKVETVADFANALGRHKAGDRVSVVLQRDGGKITVETILDPPRR